MLKLKRWAGVLLSIVLILGIVPSSTFAIENSSSPDIVIKNTNYVTSGYKAIVDTNLAVCDGQNATKTVLISLTSETGITIKNEGTQIQQYAVLNIQGQTSEYYATTNGTIYCTFPMWVANTNEITVPITSLGDFKTTPAAVKQKYSSEQEVLNSLDDNATDYYFIYLQEGKARTATPLNYVILIEIAPNGTAPVVVDKLALSTAIESVAGANAMHFYQTGDRFNGKAADTITDKTSGFWKELTADGGPLKTAQSVNENTNATQAQVDAAATALSAAIAKLISTNNINTTELYETINETYYWFNGKACPSSDFSGSIHLDRVASTNCSPASWAAFQSALAAANTELDKLFDEDGKPTEYNVSGGEEEDGYNEILEALQKAIDGLDELGSEDDLTNAQFAYKQLEVLSRRANPIGALSSGDYTEDSWGAFDDASVAAASFLASHAMPQAPIGKKEAAAYYQQLKTLWEAGYGLAGAKAGTAEISIVDSYATRKGVVPNTYARTCTVDIPVGGVLLHDALCDLLGDDYTLPFDNRGLGYGVYVNGVYVYLSQSVLGHPNTTLAYQNVRLNSGDEVLVALMELPTTSNLSGGLTFYMYRDIHDALRYITLSRNGRPAEEITAAAGEAIALTASYAYASLMDYTGTPEPLSGAKVYVSSVCTSREAALKASATVETGIVTGSDGSFTVSLPSAIGSSEGWYALNLAAADEYGGLANGRNLLIHVTDPTDLSELKAQRTSELDEIYTAYDDSFYTETQLTQVRSLYETGVSGIKNGTTSGDVEGAFQTAYDGIKSIQEENLAAMNINITAVRNLLECLPAAEDLAEGKLYVEDKPFLDLLFGTDGWYTRMTEYQKTSLTADEVALLTDFQKAWTDSNEGTDLPELPAFTLKVEAKDADTGALLNLPITVQTSSNYAMAPNGWSVDSETGRLNIAGSTRLELSFDATTNTYTLPAGAWYQVHIFPYVASADRGTYSPVDANHGLTTDIDFHYRVDKETENANLGHFYTIRKNAVVTIYYRQTDEVAAAKDAALAELETAFRNYDRSKYTEASWQDLNDAYLAGQTAVNAAETVEAVGTAKKNALDAMAAVPVREGLGSVYVTVRNDTYSTSKGAPWDGVLVNRKEVPLNDSSTMMSCIVAALEGYTVVGAETNYISSINGLKEFDGGRQSGWMGCLNDWFVNEGFANFGVADGKLHDGDEISVEYTCAFGGDIRAGTETNHDTTLYTLTLTNGTLTPDFDSAVTEYVFTLNSGAGSTVICFSGNNRAFQARAYLNGYAPAANNWIRSGDTVKVSGGDVITVGVGESAWPAMGTGVPTKYKVTIVSADDASAVVKLINAIGSVTYSNYKDKQAAVVLAKTAYDALTAAAQSSVTNLAKLTAAEKAIEDFRAVDELRGLIAALPKTVTEADREDVEAAMALYEDLTDAQRSLLTVAETNKLLNAVNALAYDTVENLEVKTELALVTSRVKNDAATVHVEAASPCLVVVKSGESYERLTAAENAEGGYDFVKTGYEDAMVFYVLLKGDANLDGELTGLDATICKSAFLGRETLDTLGAFAADLNGDGFGGDDVTVVRAAFLGEEDLEW